MDESGFPGFEATVWYGLMGHTYAAGHGVQRMNDDINKVMAMSDAGEDGAVMARKTAAAASRNSTSSHQGRAAEMGLGWVANAARRVAR